MYSGFLQDDNGNKSGTRLRAFITLVVFLAVWVMVAVARMEIPDIPETVLIFVLTLCGYPIVQRVWGEKPPQGVQK